MHKFIYIFALTALTGIFTLARAQELQSTVKFQVDPNLQITDRSVFTNLEERIQDFLNGRKWTREEYEDEERILCSFVFTISAYDQNSGRFSGRMQVNYSRPVFNSSYSSPVINWIDPDISFTYREGSPIDYVENQHVNNLSSILAYYAFVIIGLDHDTFKPGSGELYYVKAQSITAAAQNDASASGWRSFDGNRNRYWLTDNLLNPAFAQISNTLYTYHRLGLDRMYDEKQQSQAIQQIASSLLALKEIHQRRPGSFIVQLFMEAKSDEIVNIFKGAPEGDFNELVTTLTLIDGTRSSKYETILE